MDMRNVAVGVVMEVIATTTIMQTVPEEDTASPSLFQGNPAVVVVCPGDRGSALDVSSRLRVATADDSALIVVADPCEGPTSPDMGVPAGTAIAA